MNPRETLAKALGRVAELKKLDRDFTAAEVAEIDELTKSIPALRADVAKSGGTDFDALMEQLKGGDAVGHGAARFLNLKARGTSAALAQGMFGESPVGGQKALTSGDAVAPVEVQATPVSEGRPAAGLLDLVPVIPNSAARFEFLQQTARDLAAAPVAPGGTKPTSTLGLDRVPGELQVVAHLSEPIDYFLLSDFAAVEQFVRTEMLFGLVQELENQMLNGDAVAPNLTGILGMSGVLQQAFATDAITSARKAITQLETAGLVPTGFCFSPADWEAIELSTTSGSGEFVMVQSPVDRAARRLHGLPVSVSAGMADGSGVLLSQDSVALRTDAGVAIRWGEPGDAFARNQVVARAELRAAVQVTRPSGLVVVETADAGV